MGMSGEKRDKEPLAEAEAGRATFLTVLREPMPSPGGIEVQGVTVIRAGGRTIFEVGDDLVLTFDAVELVPAVALEAPSRRAAA